MEFADTNKVFGRTAVLAAALLVVGAMGGCGGVKDKLADKREAGSDTRSQQAAPIPPAPVAPSAKAAAPEPRARAERIEVAALKPAHALSVRSECTARDETGYTESIKLTVEQGRVELMEAKIEIPRRGSCGFRLADFRQTRSEPHVELQASSGTQCTVRMWRQGERFTVAFNDCQEKCTRGAFAYVWPLSVNSTDGSCL